MEREAKEKTSAEEEAMVAGEGGAGPCATQEVVEGEDSPVPAGGAGEVGDIKYAPYLAPATGIKGEEMYVYVTNVLPG